MVVRAIVDLEAEEREEAWAEDGLGLWWEGRVILSHAEKEKGVNVCRSSSAASTLTRPERGSDATRVTLTAKLP